MVIGFAMLKAVHGHEDEAYLDLRKIGGVKEAYRILGEYQIFVVMQAESAAALHRLIGRVKSIPEATDICNVLITDRDASKQPAQIDGSPLDFEVPVQACSPSSAVLGRALLT